MVIAGVQGNGQTELVEAIAGLRPFDAGEASIGGRSIVGSSPRHVSDLGVAHIPEDRGRDGLVSTMTVAENYILDTYHRQPYSRRGIFDRDAVKDVRQRASRSSTSDTPSIETLAGIPVRRQPAEGGRRARVLACR